MVRIELASRLIWLVAFTAAHFSISAAGLANDLQNVDIVIVPDHRLEHSFSISIVNHDRASLDIRELYVQIGSTSKSRVRPDFVSSRLVLPGKHEYAHFSS